MEGTCNTQALFHDNTSKLILKIHFFMGRKVLQFSGNLTESSVQCYKRSTTWKLWRPYASGSALISSTHEVKLSLLWLLLRLKKKPFKESTTKTKLRVPGAKYGGCFLSWVSFEDIYSLIIYQPLHMTAHSLSETEFRLFCAVIQHKSPRRTMW